MVWLSKVSRSQSREERLETRGTSTRWVRGYGEDNDDIIHHSSLVCREWALI